MTSQHDVQTSSSITTTGDLEYTLLVFSTNLQDSIDLNCSFAQNHSFETKMMRDCPLLVVIKYVHIFHFVVEKWFQVQVRPNTTVKFLYPIIPSGINPSIGIGPTQGQRKTLTRVGQEAFRDR